MFRICRTPAGRAAIVFSLAIIGGNFQAAEQTPPKAPPRGGSQAPARRQQAAPDFRIGASFAVRYRPLDPLIALVRAQLSAEGEIHLQPQNGAFRVLDAPERVEAVRQLVARYDVPPRRVEAVVKLIEASEDAKPVSVADSIRAVGTRLQSVLRFSRYELLDTLVLEGLEGQPLAGHLAERYRLSFTLGYFLEEGRVIPLEGFRLDKVIPAPPQDGEGRPPSYQNLVTTALNLFDGEEILFGASRMDAATDRALVLVLSVKALK